MQKSIFGLSSRPAVSNIRNLSSLMITAFISFPNKISTASFCQSFIMSVEISFLDLILGALSFMRAALQHRKLYIPPTSSSHPSSASSGPEGFDARSPFSSKSRQVCRRKSLQLIHHLRLHVPLPLKCYYSKDKIISCICFSTSLQKELVC